MIDLRNVYNPQEMEVCGFIYEGVGRGAGPVTIAAPAGHPADHVAAHLLK